MLESVQRVLALRTVSAYRTTSTAAAVVIADMVPIDLMIKERMDLHERGMEARRDIKAEVEEAFCDRWSRDTTPAAWTRRLIGNLAQFRSRKHGVSNYHMSQVLTGHGTFGAYLKRFHLAESYLCWFGEQVDTAEHTLFECRRWGQERTAVEAAVGARLTVENIMVEMMKSEMAWATIEKLIINIMMDKINFEKRLGQQEGPAE